MSSITTKVVRRARHLGVTVYTRRQWGSTHITVYQWRRVNRRHKQLPSKPTDTVVQHITVTNDDGPTAADFKRDMREVEAIGWARFQSGVSYNFCIDMRTGEVGLGQALDAAGTHTLNDKNVPGYSENLNYYAIAFSFIGMPGDTLSDKAVEATAKLLVSCRLEKAVTLTNDYDPHAKFAYKSCPTPAVIHRMPEIYDLASTIYRKALREAQR